ncbi:hypothetical protein [Teichococcus aestuarii]|uniref:hypothetical protein n=1 Tax=Teichococcus aestuarii TaxID=568898 RepID=UPI00361D33B2
MAALFGYRNWLLSGVLTATSQVASLPVSNLATPHADVTNQWRTASGARSASFVIDTGDTAAIWRLFMLAATNLNQNALVRWIVSNNADLSSPSYDSGWRNAGSLHGYQQSVVIAPAEVTGRYCQCSLNNGSNPDPFLSVGLAYAGPAYQPAPNLAADTAWLVQPARDAVQTRGGQHYVTQRYRQRGWDIAFTSIPSAELLASVAEMMRVADTGANIAFVPFIEGQPSREAVLGLLQTASGIGYLDMAAQYRTWRAQIMERL